MMTILWVIFLCGVAFFGFVVAWSPAREASKIGHRYSVHIMLIIALALVVGYFHTIPGLFIWLCSYAVLRFTSPHLPDDTTNVVRITDFK